MMNYTISFEHNPNASDIELLNHGVIQEHQRKKNMKPLDFFAYFLRDNQRQIVGGCAGDNMYGSLFVGQLWVTEMLRGQGYGTINGMCRRAGKEKSLQIYGRQYLRMGSARFLQKTWILCGV